MFRKICHVYQQADHFHGDLVAATGWALGVATGTARGADLTLKAKSSGETAVHLAVYKTSSDSDIRNGETEGHT